MRKPKEVKAQNIWAVVHDTFVTDHIATTHSLVRAKTAEEAREKFNRLAATRREYPYCWTDASSIYKAEIIE